MGVETYGFGVWGRVASGGPKYDPDRTKPQLHGLEFKQLNRPVKFLRLSEIKLIKHGNGEIIINIELI